jgi:3'(2'), 5'-bisphosphate nucleotidase
VILKGLRTLLPDVPVISEESVGGSPPGPLSAGFILVDPLDGTRELLAGRDEFTVNVAIVYEGTPALGIVAAPALGLLWRGTQNRGAERLRLEPGAPAGRAQERAAVRTRPAPGSGLIAAVSRSNLDPATEAFLSTLPVTERISSGSAVKFCQVAQGSADVYPRLSPTYEWDVAAGHAVLAAAGGGVTAPGGSPLPYGRIAQRFLVPAFIAWGDPESPFRQGAGEANHRTS